MWRHLFGAVTVAAVVVALAGGAAGQESRAMVRTHQGISYSVDDLSLEVFYTIGEPKEKKEEREPFRPTILNVTTAVTPTPGAGEQMPGAPPGEKEEKLLRGHSRASEIAVWREGVETRIAWDRIRAMQFARKPVVGSGLPPYISHYRYSVSVTLVGGERVDADYVNLGTAILRGITPSGRVDIPWEEVEQVTLER